ncbi:ABC transporter permease subunit [Anaerosacchariphilus polymeriproducens]|uniref:ABC transporter permease n=1 Tax=Anaerosacchariphilus polymeriproducens TaxID=1812858 RepID=A0A371ATD3_9FIRM|nr:ABC transporter permease subunit [Anaerosacchariphilus polymeriproducens]RDU22834.1 ABC transporter permease [Anaerosacchariphilus polymeriproducens]
MSLTLFKREIKANYKLVLIFIGVLSLYGSMIVAMFDPDMGKSLELMLESMPEVFAAFGMAEIGTTLLTFVVNYLYGFLLIALPSVFIIILSNRLMARYISQGSMAYLLATPNKRKKIAFTQAVFLVISVLCLVIYITVLCIIVGQIMFPGELEIKKFVLVNIGLFGLLVFLSGLCFCSSSIFSDSKFSNGVGAGAIIAFIIIQMLSQVGEKFENLKFLTPLTLFQTNGLIAGDSQAVWAIILLYVIGIILFGTGISIFCKRDLSI